jgi:hypothetical protein
MNNYVAKIVMSVTNNDKIQKITEQYLIKAESVTDAEARVYKEFENEGFDWELISVVKSPIIKVINF